MKLRIAGVGDGGHTVTAAVARLEVALSRYAEPCPHCNGDRVLEDASECPVCDVDGLVERDSEHRTTEPPQVVEDESGVRAKRDLVTDAAPQAWAELDEVLADLQERVGRLEAWRQNHAGGPPRAKVGA